MEQNHRLYPLKFLPAERKMPWGKETWLLADLAEMSTMVHSGWLGANTVAELMETFLEDMVGEASFSYYGLQFPVTVKLLEVEGRTPLLVTADDETAAARYDAFGKTVFWYVAEAAPGSEISIGFEKDTDASSFYEGCIGSRPAARLRSFRPSKGDCFEILPGLVYGASGRIKIVEVSEASDLDFTLVSHDGSAGEHLDEAFDLIRYSSGGAAPVVKAWKDGLALLSDRPEFRISEMKLETPLRIESGPRGTFSIYYCLSGGLVVKSADGSSSATEEGRSDIAVRKGELVLVPAGMGDFLLGPSAEGTVLLEVIAGAREEPDSYLDDVTPKK